VGFNSEPLYQTGRAELALAELARTGAFDRSHLLLISPTGTGWVDHTLIEAAELLTRGDIATCCIQYARYPSFLSIQKVALGRGQFRLLLWGVKQRLEERPPERRPRVLVFGESLGAWTSSDVIMYQGIEGLRPLRHRPRPVGGAAVAGQVVEERHDPRQPHAGPVRNRRCLRPP
jgi:uncharacterized membrane protein